MNPAAFLIAVLLTGEHESPFPSWDDLGSRGFAQEVLFGYGMQRTPRFDDYTKGSYHIRPGQLVDDLSREAPLYKLDLRAVLVIGPAGPLWSYDVIAFLREDACTRVNWVVMPHARITVKKSACLPEAAVEEVLAQAHALATTSAGTTNAASSDDLACLLFAEHGHPPTESRASRLGCDDDAQAAIFKPLDAALDSLYSKLQITYSGYSPVEDK